MHYALDSSKWRRGAFGLKGVVKTCQDLFQPFALHIMPRRTVTSLARNAMQICKNMKQYAKTLRFFSRVLRWPSSPRSGLSQFGAGHFPRELTKYPRMSRPSSASCREFFSNRGRNSTVTLQQFLRFPSGIFTYLYNSLHVFFSFLHMSSLLKQNPPLRPWSGPRSGTGAFLFNILSNASPTNQNSATKCHTPQQSATRRQRMAKIWSNKSIQLMNSDWQFILSILADCLLETHFVGLDLVRALHRGHHGRRGHRGHRQGHWGRGHDLEDSTARCNGSSTLQGCAGMCRDVFKAVIIRYIQRSKDMTYHVTYLYIYIYKYMLHVTLHVKLLLHYNLQYIPLHLCSKNIL